MFKLIRDKVPELAKKDGQVVNYATAENEELYIILLKNKLIEETQEFLNSGNVQELVDVKAVISAILKAAHVTEEDFDKIYQEKLKTHGGFDKHYIGFFPDEVPEQPKPAEESK